jgi:hypothetical protein
MRPALPLWYLKELRGKHPLYVHLPDARLCPKSLPQSSLNPTSVTSVRCSFRCAPFSPRNRTVHQRAFRRPTSIPSLCGLRDLCAMLSPMRALSRPETEVSTKEPSADQPQSPLSVASVTSVRCSFHDGCDLAEVSYSIIAFSARNRKELTATAKMIRRPTITSWM